MHNILIVEDDIIVRTGIKNCINWEENGFFPPFEACNGEEALKLIEGCKVDVLLTDIVLPKMNGLELVKRVKESGIAIEVLILSCHNDFEYVREAMQLGACDYLFKQSMSPEDIIKAIKKAISKVDDRVETNDRISLLEQMVQRSSNILKEDFILGLINGKKISCSEYSRSSRTINLSLSPINLIVMTVKIDTSNIPMSGENLGDQYIFKDSVTSIVRGILSSYKSSETVSKSVDEYIIVLSFAEENSTRIIRDICYQAACDTILALKTRFNLTVSIGISKFSHTIESIDRAYGEAVSCAARGIFAGSNNIFFYGDLEGLPGEGSLNLGALLEEFSHIDLNAYKEKIRTVFQEVRNHKFIKTRDVIELASNLVGMLLKKALESKDALEEVYSREKEIYSKLYKFSSVKDIEDFVYKIAVEIESIIDSKYPNFINEAVKFIEKHLADCNFSLEMVSDHVKMSKSHFSRLFGELIGKNFIEYVTELRIKKAMELYKTADYKVYEIAELVGYSDWRYFCRIYKKYTGNKLSSIKK